MATLNHVPGSNLKITAHTTTAKPNNPPQIKNERRKEKSRPVVTTTAVSRTKPPMVTWAALAMTPGAALSAAARSGIVMSAWSNT